MPSTVLKTRLCRESSQSNDILPDDQVKNTNSSRDSHSFSREKRFLLRVQRRCEPRSVRTRQVVEQKQKVAGSNKYCKHFQDGVYI